MSVNCSKLTLHFNEQIMQEFQEKSTGHVPCSTEL